MIKGKQLESENKKLRQRLEGSQMATVPEEREREEKVTKRQETTTRIVKVVRDEKTDQQLKDTNRQLRLVWDFYRIFFLEAFTILWLSQNSKKRNNMRHGKWQKGYFPW